MPTSGFEDCMQRSSGHEGKQWAAMRLLGDGQRCIFRSEEVTFGPCHDL